MYSLAQLPATLGLLTLAVLQTRARAANVIDMLSFGGSQAVSTNARDISGWHVSGFEGYTPEVFSDRLMLTPPSPGPKRGSAWAEKSSPYTEWALDVLFRAAGPERGSGNLQIWYAKDGEKEVGTSSLYTVGSFDGLVIVVDQYGSKGGSIRGFLNDGSKSYNSQHNLDQLAFGHCDYPYRNRGLFSHLNLRLSGDAFEVTVDGQPCFNTHKVKLPSGYQFGVSAASAETPDSFEVSQFIVTATASSNSPSPPPPPASPDHQDGPFKIKEGEPKLQPSDVPDAPASNYKSSEAQFEDLHNRLQTMQHELADLMKEFQKVKEVQDQTHATLINVYLHPMHEIQNQLHNRMLQIERKVDGLDTGAFKAALNDMQNALTSNHENIMHHLPSLGSVQSPKLGFFVFVVIAFQLLLAGSYVIYKRRKNSLPKKYL